MDCTKTMDDEGITARTSFTAPQGCSRHFAGAAVQDGDAQPQPFELPTPSSTSKLEKVQPIDNVGLSFTPPPQYQGVTQSQPRAARYESQEPENEEQVSKYSEEYEEPQETTVLNAPS